MVLLEMKFGIFLFCAVMMFAKFQPSLYLDLYVVKIENGPIIGEENVDHFAFKGIPYAEAKRFTPPKPFTRKWHRILSFNSFGSECAQYDHFTYGFHGHEDCLNLNVFVPKAAVEANHLFPVVFFIHGGAFMYGSGKFYGQDVFMKQQDVILVTINYRLGILGFLSTEDKVLPGNFGLKDQVEALKWVQRNIHAFNGDKDNVTIAGFSAGGASVQLHYMSPMSDGLFKNGISHSGVALNPWVMQENARKKAFQIGKSFGCKYSSNDETNSKELLKCLKKISAEKLVTSAKQFQSFLYNPFSPFGVVVESKDKSSFLSAQPRQLLENQSFNSRPWITTMTRDEGLYPAAEFHKNKTLKFFDENWNELAPFLLDYNETTSDESKKLEWSTRIRKFYFNEEEINMGTFENLTKLMSDRLFKDGFYNSALLQSAHSKTYCYYFEFKPTSSIANILENSTDYLGISHGDDLFLVYNNRKLRNYTEEEKAMGIEIIQMYKLFNQENKAVFGEKEIVPVETNNMQCMNLKSPTEYAMLTIDKKFGEIEFWKSLSIPE